MMEMITFMNPNIETNMLFLEGLIILSIAFLCFTHIKARSMIPVLDKYSYYNGFRKPNHNNSDHYNVRNTLLNKYENNSTKNKFISPDYDLRYNSDYNKKILKALPFISIVIPVRNEEKHIKRCLLSLLAQEYPNFEIIAVDDNSTDKTLNIMNEIKNNEYLKDNNLPCRTLKIVSLNSKPDGWAGKTWASQNGFLQSKGSILLFTDADTNYARKDVLLQTILYMLNEKLDVLTGIPTHEKLNNFWAKFAIPLWDSISVLFGVNSADVNDPRSKIAYLIGCFFLIKRHVFVNIGTFEAVHDAIQEDKSLGVLVKKNGYKIKLVQLKEMLYTLWVDDLTTLWHGIGRTLAPLVMKNKLRVVMNLLVVFFASMLPFMIFPINISILTNSLFSHQKDYFTIYLDIFLLVLDLIVCCIMINLVSKKCIEYGISPLCSLTIIFASVFAFVACLYNVAPLLVFGSTKPIIWQGREYTYKKKQEGFSF